MNNLEQLKALCKTFTILYVEDDTSTQEAMANTLRRVFEEVYVANNGAIGLELFKEHHPDIIITDIQMPVLSGLSMAKAIKEINATTPIIVTTAFNEEHYFIEAIENDIDAFLLKPIDKEKLFQTLFKHVAHLLQQKKSAQLDELKKIDAINQASEESIKSLANLFPFPALFYKNNQLIFVNTAAAEMLTTIKITSIQEETSFISQFRLTREKKEKIRIPTEEGVSKVFWVHPNAFFMGADFDLVQTYIFVDITSIS
ncbi:MAG: response regulator [Sulfurospirillaceae bacterium]|nr:response regulator [Sulfurospirillaceae bacterium]